MATKMQAAVVTAFKKPLEMQEWDVPTPGPGQILVKTEAAASATPTCTPPTATGR